MLFSINLYSENFPTVISAIGSKNSAKVAIIFHFHNVFKKKMRRHAYGKSAAAGIAPTAAPHYVMTCCLRLCHGLAVAAAVGEECHRSSHIDSGQSTDDHTEDHCECKASDRIAAKDEDTEQYQQSAA